VQFALCVAPQADEVGVNEGEDILGEVGCLDRDRRQVRRLWKTLHEPAPVGHPLDPRQCPRPIAEYATAKAAQFAITRARLQEARSARMGRPKGQAASFRGSCGLWTRTRGNSVELSGENTAGSIPPGLFKIPPATVVQIIRNIAGRRGRVRDCQKRMFVVFGAASLR
jgi:hypothetical protein